MALLTPRSLETSERALVLGGTGFLGRHLVDELLQSGISVRVFTRNANTARLPSAVQVIEGSFVDGSGLEQALSDVNLVYHLVSTTIPNEADLDPIAEVADNLTATLRLLHLMEQAGVSRIVYASSGGTVYGNPTTLPVSESHPLRPICSYGIVKVAVEGYLELLARRKGLIVNVLRIANPYGAGQSPIGRQGVIATFAQRLLANQPLEIWGDGSATRDYVHVSDVSRALSLAGQRPHSGTFNIGSGVGHSICEVLALLQEALDLHGVVRYRPQAGHAVDKTYLDIRKARDELCWSPQMPLKECIALYTRSLPRKRERLVA